MFLTTKITKNPIIYTLIFIVLSNLLHNGLTCIPEQWREQHVVQMPTRDTTTTPIPVLLPIKLRLKANRTIHEIISTDRCGQASLGASLDPYELNPSLSSTSSESLLASAMKKKVVHKKHSRRMINGERANVDSWPWIVGIYLRHHDDSNLRCAGSLIDKRFVLTSAYCVHGVPLQNLFVSAGSSDITGGKFYAVEVVKIPGDYSNDQARENDIAILKLKKPVVLSSNANTICLPSKRDRTVVYNKNLVVAGWGSTDGVNSPSSLSKNLMQVIMTVFKDKAVCEKGNKYCAYKRASKNSNVCWRDLGAPLMFFMHNRWHVYGIASSFDLIPGTKECNPSSPSYYTIVPDHLNWIGYQLESLQKGDIDEDYNEEEIHGEGKDAINMGVSLDEEDADPLEFNSTLLKLAEKQKMSEKFKKELA